MELTYQQRFQGVGLNEALKKVITGLELEAMISDPSARIWGHLFPYGGGVDLNAPHSVVVEINRLLGNEAVVSPNSTSAGTEISDAFYSISQGTQRDLSLLKRMSYSSPIEYLIRRSRHVMPEDRILLAELITDRPIGENPVANGTVIRKLQKEYEIHLMSDDPQDLLTAVKYAAVLGDMEKLKTALGKAEVFYKAAGQKSIADFLHNQLRRLPHPFEQ